MRRRASATEPLFNFLFIDAADVSRHPTLLEDMIAKHVDGVIIRNMFDSSTISRIKDRLARNEVPFIKRIFNGFADGPDAPYTLGRAIVSADPDLVEYFDVAHSTRKNLKTIFEPEVDFEKRMAEVFGALASGRPVAVPAGPAEGQTYAPATFRFLPEGRDIGVHVGNSFLRLAQAKHLSSLVDVGDQLSYFITIHAPQGGGELIVYGLEWDDVASKFPAELGPNEMVYDRSGVMIRLVELCDKEAYKPGDGDLLIFDGGRYYHRVSHIIGADPRCTLGGFLAFSRDKQQLCYWS
jgi:hapalindole-type alkaloid chlorinase